MDEIKRGRVPWRRPTAPELTPRGPAGTKGAQDPEILGARAAKTRSTPRPVLDNANAVAFKGNALTGAASIDNRKDLPPFGWNPAPKAILARRRDKIEPTFARPAPEPQHVSADQIFARLKDPKTRAAAKLQHLINKNPVVRAAFERETGSRVVRDQRADGTITLFQPGSDVAVATGAMTGAPQRDFYALLHAMDQAVQAQAAEVAALGTASGGSYYGGSSQFGLPGFPLSDGLGLPTGAGIGPSGLSDDEDEDGFSAAIGGVNGLPTAPGFGTGPQRISQQEAGSVDTAAQKVQLLMSRVAQMYSLISGMFSKYNQNAQSAIGNLK